MIIRWLTGLIKGEKRKEKVKTEIEELKKAILEDPKFRDEILRELEYRTGRRDLLKVGVLGLLGLGLGLGGSHAYNTSLNTNTVREVVSDYAGVRIPKPCTCIVAQDGTGDFDVSPNEDASEVIQKAIDYAHSKGGEVRIREGEYVVKSAHLRFPSNVWVEGTGLVTFNIKWGGYFGKVGYALITNENYDTSDENIVLKNIRFIAEPSPWPDWEKGSRLVVFKNVKNLIIENCYFSHHAGGGELHIWGGKDVFISNTKAIHSLARGLRVGDAVFKVTGEGVLIQNCEAAPVDGVLAFNVGGQRIAVINCYGHDAISGCWIEHCGTAPPTSQIKVIECYFERVRNEGVGVSGVGSPITSVLIEGNIVRDSQINGILIGGSSRVIARSNSIEGCGWAGIAIRASDDVIVDSNEIKSCKCGIFVGGDRCIVSSNRLMECDTGILIRKEGYYNFHRNGFHNYIVSNVVSCSCAIEEKSDYNVIVSNCILNGKVKKSGKNTISKNL